MSASPSMFDLSGHGMTLRWPGTHDPKDRRVLVEAGPVSAAHVLHVLCSIDGGPARLCRGWPVATDKAGGVQTFAALLPETPPGAHVEWWPVLSNGLQELSPDVARKKRTAEPPQATPAPRDDTAPFRYEMELLTRVTAPLERTPTVIGDTPEGLMIVFPLGTNGTLRGPKLNGSIAHVGGDWMRVRPDGVGISEVRVVVDCDDGAKLLGEYSGVVNFGKDGYAALSRGGGPKRAEVQLVPRFVTAAPEYKWLNAVQCVGLGRVTMSELLVEYDLYAARSHAFAENGDTDG